MIQLPSDYIPAMVGKAFSYTVGVTGGTPPFSFAITYQILPPGLSLDPVTGVISGIPSGESGQYLFQVQVTDSAPGTPGRAWGSFIIFSVQPLIITTTSLPNVNLNGYFATRLEVTGGSGVWVWSIASGNLPPGLGLMPGGVLVGSPTAAGTFSFVAQVQDQFGYTATRRLSIVVKDPNPNAEPLSVQTSMPSATMGASYSGSVAASGGTPPYNFSLTGGALPAGLTMSSSGEVSGMPTQMGAFQFTVQVTDAVGSSAVGTISLSVAANTPDVDLAGSLPHLASGQGWATTITLINLTTADSLARLDFYGDDGVPLSLPVAFPQSPSDDPLTASSLERTLRPGASFLLSSQNPQASVVGSGRLLTTSGTSAFAVFRYNPSGQEALVPLEARTSGAYLLPFDNTGGISTGIAVTNVVPSAATIPVTVRDDHGVIIGSESIALAGQGHTSFMLPSKYVETAGKRGLLEVHTPLGGRISLLGLRVAPIAGTDTFAVTTIPVLAKPAGGGSMAHVAVGGGWRTTFTIVNAGASSGQAQLQFTNDKGAPLSMSLTFPQTGRTATGDGVSETLAPGASLVITAQGAGDAVVGSAQLTAGNDIGGFAVFRYDPSGQEAVVPLETRQAKAYVLSFDNTAGVRTGVAVSNTSQSSASIPTLIRDDNGRIIGSGTISLPAQGHTSFMLGDRYTYTGGRRGTVEFGTPSGGRISVLGLRAAPTGAGDAFAVTTIPTLDK